MHIRRWLAGTVVPKLPHGRWTDRRRPPLASCCSCSVQFGVGTYVRGGAWTGGYPLGWKASMRGVELKPRRRMRRRWRRAAMASPWPLSACLIRGGWSVGRDTCDLVAVASCRNGERWEWLTGLLVVIWRKMMDVNDAGSCSLELAVCWICECLIRVSAINSCTDSCNARGGWWWNSQKVSAGNCSNPSLLRLAWSWIWQLAMIYLGPSHRKVLVGIPSLSKSTEGALQTSFSESLFPDISANKLLPSTWIIQKLCVNHLIKRQG